MSWLLLTWLSAIARAETLVVLSRCEKDPCIVMDLYPASPPKEFAKKTLKGKRSSGDASELTLAVRGMPGKGYDRELTLLLHSAPDPKPCHGIAKGAVAGIQGTRPILYTSGGPVEVTDGSLRAGCADCLTVMNDDKTVASPPSPSEDLEHLGLGPTSFSFAPSGEAYFKTAEDKCLALATDGPFAAVDGRRCQLPDLKPPLHLSVRTPQCDSTSQRN